MEVEIETLLGQYRMQKVSGSHSEIEVGQRRESGRKKECLVLWAAKEGEDEEEEKEEKEA